jgi:hypothetical protein
MQHYYHDKDYGLTSLLELQYERQRSDAQGTIRLIFCNSMVRWLFQLASSFGTTNVCHSICGRQYLDVLVSLTPLPFTACPTMLTVS